MGRGEVQRGRERLCHFCFPVPHFMRDTDKPVCVQEKEHGAQGKQLESGNRTAESIARRLVPLGPQVLGVNSWGAG